MPIYRSLLASLIKLFRYTSRHILLLPFVCLASATPAAPVDDHGSEDELHAVYPTAGLVPHGVRSCAGRALLPHVAASASRGPIPPFAGNLQDVEPFREINEDSTLEL